jgi:chemotaxis protein MotB
VSTTQNEGANYFASMTDLLVGVLFILIIMVAYLAFQISTEERVPRSLFEQVKKELDARVSEVQALNAEVAALKEEIERLKEELRKSKEANPLEQYMAQGQAKRDEIVKETVKELKALNINAEIGRSNNVVTISGANLFASGRSDLASVDGAVERVNNLAKVLRERIQCYAIREDTKIENLKDCNPDLLFVEAVFIEGHTDNIPVQRVLEDGSKSNLELSARRATNTYNQLVDWVPELEKFSNPAGEQALSVAAYGEQRPMASNDSPEGREMNRRIDIRFDMHIPKDQHALSEFLERFK